MPANPARPCLEASSAVGELTIKAFHALPGAPALVPIVPAPRWRDWMNATTNRFANRCLPLLMANESGWVLLNPHPFEAVWNGGDSPASVTIEYDDARSPGSRFVESIFGHGIVTWSMPYLFRTAPGYNTLARGPANWPKDGLCALEGLVETDWATATFTMNWKFTRADHHIRFERDEPFCMIVPQRRGELESASPEICDVRTDPDTARGWQRWLEGRDQLRIKKFLGAYSQEFAEYGDAWEQDYFKGRTSAGEPAPEHETKRRLRAFAEPGEDA